MPRLMGFWPRDDEERMIWGMDGIDRWVQAGGRALFASGSQL